MATNPMQKKARNSFILGVMVALIICAVIGLLAYVFLLSPNKGTSKNGAQRTVYVLNTDVKSGQIITPEMLTAIKVYENMVPSNYADGNVITAISLMDKDGNKVTTKDGSLYIKDNGESIPVKQSQINGKFYKGDEELSQSAAIAKVDLNKNTILTSSVIIRSDSQKTKDSTRYIEYNMLTLGTTISVGDFVDIRVSFPNGQDLIVVAKKEIKSIKGTTVGFELTEEDIALMRSAIVEAYIMKASNLYVAKYVAAGEQAEAVKTYVPTGAVQDLIRNNPNIEEEARTALESRFTSGIRDYIDSNRNAYAVEEKENLEAGVQKEIENAKAAREAYLTGLSTAAN